MYNYLPLKLPSYFLIIVQLENEDGNIDDRGTTKDGGK